MVIIYLRLLLPTTFSVLTFRNIFLCIKLGKTQRCTCTPVRVWPFHPRYYCRVSPRREFFSFRFRTSLLASLGLLQTGVTRYCSRLFLNRINFSNNVLC